MSNHQKLELTISRNPLTQYCSCLSILQSQSSGVCNRKVPPPSQSFSSVYSCTFSRLLAVLPRPVSLHIVSCFLTRMPAEIPIPLENWMVSFSPHTILPVSPPPLTVLILIFLARGRHLDGQSHSPAPVEEQESETGRDPGVLLGSLCAKIVLAT